LLVQLATLHTSIINYKVSPCQAAPVILATSAAGHHAHLHYQLQG
jgi:hypothetical protein